MTLEAAEPNGRAVLHVHGFADYFFHTEFAEWWTARGYTFYALDLRKYGRSLREHQTPNYVGDLHEYFAEIDLAWWRITQRDGHREVIASGHSTGGLTVPLWAHERRPVELLAMVLNSPWFDMQGSAWLRSPATRVALERLGSSRPMQEIPRKISGVYGRALHRDHGGEWDYDLTWKPLESRPVYVGWLRAVRRGHAQLHAGLDVACPTLVLSSSRSYFGPELDGTPAPTTSCSTWSRSAAGPRRSVGTSPRSPSGAIHDIVLSRPDVRAAAYATIQTWLDSWGRGPRPRAGGIRSAGRPGRSAPRGRSRRVAGSARAVGPRSHPAGRRPPTRARSARPRPSRRPRRR